MKYLNFLFSAVALIISLVTAYWQFFRKPNLKLIYEDQDPFRKLLIPLNTKPDYDLEWYIRVQVKNLRRVIAKNCFGKLVEWYTNGKKVNSFDPIKLHWVSNKVDDYSSINLSYEEFDYLDLFYTIKKMQKINIYTNTDFRGLPIYNLNLKDEHIFKVAIYCDNEVSKFKYFRTWYEKEDPEGKLRFPRVEEISVKKLRTLINRP